MESVAASKPLSRTEVGSKPSAKRDARIETVYGSREQSDHVGTGSRGNASLANHLVQLCSAVGRSLHSSKYSRLGNSSAWRRGSLLRHGPAGRIGRLQGAWI